MNKKTFLLIFFLIIYLFAYTQTIVSEGVLKYNRTSILINKSGKDVKRVQKCSINFSDNYLKNIEQINLQTTSTIIHNLRDQTSFLYLNNKEKYYKFEDKFNPNFFGIGLYENTAPTIRYLNDTLTINNLLCKKAVYSFEINNETKEIEVWYCADYKIHPNEKINYIFKELNGLPVKFNFEQQSGMSLTGMGMSNPHIEFVLDAFYTTKDNNISMVDETGKYIPVIDENEKMSKIMEIVSSGRIKANIKIDSSNQKGTTITKKLGDNITLSWHSPFKVNDTLKNFKAVDIGGSEKTLNSYAGKIIVLNFWFDKCGPCIAEMPMLNKTKALFDDKKVVFVSMTYNTKQEVEDVLKTNKFDFEKLINARDMIDMYEIASYPSTLIIDINHVIRFLKLGRLENEDELKNEINKLL